MVLEDATKLIETPAQVLDKIVEVLGKAGIELPAFVLQLFLLVPNLVVLFVAVRLSWAATGAKPLELLGAVALGLIAIGIVFWLVVQALLPNRLIGRVEAMDLNGVVGGAARFSWAGDLGEWNRRFEDRRVHRVLQPRLARPGSSRTKASRATGCYSTST